MDPNAFRMMISEELAKSRDELLLRLSSFGLDIHHPLEQQADFKHLRRWRKVVESTSMRVILTLVTLTVTGAAGAVWASFKPFALLFAYVKGVS